VGLVDRLQPDDPGQIGPFRLLGRLGEGSMGRVFLGESRGGRKVAIKAVHPHYASDPEFRCRFAREVAAARQVGGFHTAAVVGADPWMATAYIPGPPLAEAVAGGGPLDEAGMRQLGAALAAGLAAIHGCGLIHRTSSPATSSWPTTGRGSSTSASPEARTRPRSPVTCAASSPTAWPRTPAAARDRATSSPASAATEHATRP
jgi:serine/threonine protein kinase